MTKYGLIGHPISHSGSPDLFARAYGGRWPYDLIKGEDFEVSWQRFLSEYQAINITAPFKEDAFRKILEIGVIGGGNICGVSPGQSGDDILLAIGAVNIAVKEADGLVHGYNSDYLGVLKILRDRGFGPGHTAVVAGFGGAGKAAAAAARAAGMDVVICNRTRYSPDIRPLEELPILCCVADILIYTLAFPVQGLDSILNSREGVCADSRKISAGSIPESRRPAAILEANYRTPCLASAFADPDSASRSQGSSGPCYIPGTEWLRAQAVTGYPLMTGCPVSPAL